VLHHFNAIKGVFCGFKMSRKYDKSYNNNNNNITHIINLLIVKPPPSCTLDAIVAMYSTNPALGCTLYKGCVCIAASGGHCSRRSKAAVVTVFGLLVYSRSIQNLLGRPYP
jgi:hypothetical protein